MKTNKLFKTFLTAGLVATTLLTGCSSKSSSEPVKIGIPSDATNGGRGLLLLEKAGLIDVDDKAGWTPELKDVTKYKYNIEIVYNLDLDTSFDYSTISTQKREKTRKI